MSIESCISYVKHVKKGTLISYGGTYEAEKKCLGREEKNICKGGVLYGR